MTHRLMVVPAGSGNLKEMAEKIKTLVESQQKTVSILDVATLNAESFLKTGKLNDFLQVVEAEFQALSTDTVLIQGLSDAFYAFDLNKDIAVALDATVAMVGDADLASQMYGDLETVDANQIDESWLKNWLSQTSERRVTPPMFNHALIGKAKAANKRIVLPEGNEPRTVEAASICAKQKIARCVLIGDPAQIQKIAQEKNVSLEGVEILEPNAEAIERYVAPMVELRKVKGLTSEQATEQLQDTVVLATMMLQQGEVDGLVSGAVHTTADTIRPALQLIKTSPDTKIVSSIFFMCLPQQVLVFGDCAINPVPQAAKLADIAIQSADSAKAFGIEPRVAMISYSTGDSGLGPEVEKIKEATRLAKEKRPDLMIDGPLQYDAAIVPSVGKKKAPNSPVAGQATVFVFPDLNTGNSVYKAVQRSANIVAVGPMLQGLRKPVNDLSRGCLVEDIVFTIALTAIQGA